MIHRIISISCFKWPLTLVMILYLNLSLVNAQDNSFSESLARVDVLINQDLKLALAYSMSLEPNLTLGSYLGNKEKLMLKQAQIYSGLGKSFQADSILRLLSNLSIKNSSQEHRANFFLLKAQAMMQSGNYTEAVLQTNQAALIYDELNDVEGLYEVNLLYAYIYSSLGNQEKSLNYIHQALKNERALSSIQKSILIFEKASLLGMSGKLIEQANVMKELTFLIEKNSLTSFDGKLNLAWANLYLSEENYEFAQPFLNKAENDFRALNDRRNLHTVFLNKAIVFSSKNNYFAQRLFLQRAQEQAKKLGDVQLIFDANLKLANLFFQYIKFDDALFQANLVITNSSFSKQKVAAYDLMKSIYLAQNRFQEGLSVMEKRQALRDSIKVYEFDKALASSQVDFDISMFDEKKTEIEHQIAVQQLKRQNHVLVIRLIVIVFILSLLFGFGLYFFLKSENEKRNRLLSQKLIYLQLNTHFVFNSLTAIQCLIIQNKVVNAEYYLQMFADMMQNIIKLSTRTLIALNEELNFQRAYLKLQKLRFADDLKYEINISEDIDQQEYNIPPFLIYPYLEYAIETCIQKKGAEGIIGIQLKKIDDYLLMILEDKGIGFLKQDEGFLKRPNLGEVSLYELTKNRLREHNSWFATKYRMQLLEIKDENDQEISVLQFKIKIE